MDRLHYNYETATWDKAICEAVDSSYHIADLVMKYMLKQLSAEEQEELRAWVSRGNQQFFDYLTRLQP